MIALLVRIADNNAALIAVLAPLIAAGVCLLVPAGRWSSAPAILGAALAAISGGRLADRALSHGLPEPIAQALLPLQQDGVGVFVAALVAIIGALTALALPSYQANQRTAPLTASLFCFSLSGWIAACYAGDLVTLFLAIQIGVLGTVGLAALGADEERGALHGAFRLLMANVAAAALMIVGFALVARAMGGWTFADLAEAQVVAPGAALAGFGLSFAACASLAGIAPLHAWTGAFYGRAAPFAGLAFAALGIVALLGALARLAAYAVAAPALGEGVSQALLTLGLASVAIGSLQAAGARDLRRLAGYAIAAQAGCALVALALGSPAGFASALVQFTAIAVSSLAIFAGAPAQGGLAALDGLVRRAPLSSAALAAGALSLMGAPLTLGFLGRWRLIEAGVGGGWWWAAGAVIVTSLAGALYGGRLIERIYFRRASAPQTGARAPWRVLAAPALLAAIGAVAWGVDPTILLRAADGAARFLTGPPS